MVLPFIINGARAVIPGVYDRFRVEDSLPAVAPAGRSVVILGESEEGVPSSELDLSINFFTDYKSVQDFYKSGSIVDAARQLFSNQPSNVFGGAVERLYVWKTNATTRAERVITSPANFGSIVAARYGESGNFIKSQIKTAQAETKPTATFVYLPSPTARSFTVSVNGATSAALALAAVALPATGTPADLVTKLNTVTGLTATGGTSKTVITGGTIDLALTATDGDLTLTKTGGAGTFDTASLAVGDVLLIPVGTGAAGGAGENAGVYIVLAATTTVLTVRRVKKIDATAEIAVGAFDLTAVSALPAADVAAWSEITVSVTATTPSGVAASLELAGTSGALFAAGNMMKWTSLANILSQNGATLGSISATVPTAGQLKISLSSASWSRLPKVGDVVWIPQGSPIAGAANQNVGLHIVVSTSANNMTVQSAYGLTTIAVSSTALNGNTSPLQLENAFVSTSVAGAKIDSSAERKVRVEATRTTDGETFPATSIGGRTALELSYNDGVATAATVTIDQNRRMTIAFTGGPASIVINTRKYATVGDLSDYLNTLTGFSARIPDATMRSLPSSALDMVTAAGIMSAHSTAAYNGRLKVDYYDWKKFFDDNFGLLAFKEGTLVLKSGLPGAEATAAFLSGAVIGSSSNQDFVDGLDAALKVNARIILPLVSRDSRLDIEDGLTDENSSYTIDSINTAVKSHVATASSTLMRRERFGAISFHGSFTDSIQKAGEQGYERTQMGFQMFRATDSKGNLTWFQPWMGMAALAAGRSQAPAATPMLRKPFNLNNVKHIGDLSVYSDTLERDFDPEDRGQMAQAIEAGLLVWQAVAGTGIVLGSPDLTTRSRVNDPQGWVWERANVLFGADEVRATLRDTLENLIGNNTLDVSVSVVDKLAKDVLNGFVTAGSLIRYTVDNIVKLGNGYQVFLSLFLPEALEFIGVDVTAKRDLAA